ELVPLAARSCGTLAARGRNLLQCVTSILSEASVLHGHGAEEGSGEAAGSLGGSQRDRDDAGTRVLRAAEHGAERREVRPAHRGGVPEVLQEQFRPPQPDAGNVLPDAAAGLL